MSPPIRDGSGNDIGAIRLGDGSEISEVRTGAGDVLFSAISGSVVDRFERNNLNSPTSGNWGVYTGTTGSATIQSSTVLQGNSTLKLDAGGSITTQRSAAYSPTEITFLVQADAGGNDFDGSRVIVQNSGIDVIFFDLEGDNTAEAGLGNGNLGTWSDNTTFRARLFNIDYNNNQYDAELIRESDGTVVGSASGIAFDNSASAIDEIRLARNSSSSGTTNPMYIDDITSAPNA